MSMKNSLRCSPVFVAILFAVVFTSCKQSGSPGSTGSVEGTVTLVDSAFNRLGSSAGVTVALEQSKYSTQTDASGHWRIDNVTAGNYNVALSKPGFGSLTAYGVTIAGPGTSYLTPQMYFGSEPAYAPVVSNVAIAQEDSGSTKVLKGNISGDPYSIVVFLDHDSTSQPGDVHELWNFPRPAGQFSISAAALHQAGFPSGTIAYLTAVDADFASVWQQGGPVSSGTYYDPNANASRLISPGPRSNVVVVTVP